LESKREKSGQDITERMEGEEGEILLGSADLVFSGACDSASIVAVVGELAIDSAGVFVTVALGESSLESNGVVSSITDADVEADVEATADVVLLPLFFPFPFPVPFPFFLNVSFKTIIPTIVQRNAYEAPTKQGKAYG
jgi:hypothetical protein